MKRLIPNWGCFVRLNVLWNNIALLAKPIVVVSESLGYDLVTEMPLLSRRNRIRKSE